MRKTRRELRLIVSKTDTKLSEVEQKLNLVALNENKMKQLH